MKRAAAALPATLRSGQRGEADPQEKPTRDLLRRYFGKTCRVLALRRAETPGEFLYVVEWGRHDHRRRTIGTVGSSAIVVEHSVMDLRRPDRLVHAYERAMLVTLALAESSDRVLLLGLGGGAMCRHLDRYLPETSLTVVERDRTMIALARGHFGIRRRVVHDDAAKVVAKARRAFDAILVDIYDAKGSPPFADRFWRDCRRALRPGGVIAVNWAGSPEGASPRRDIARVLPLLPGSFLFSLRGLQPNIIQLAPSVPDLRVADIRQRFRAFARRHDLPREDRAILRRGEISAARRRA